MLERTTNNNADQSLTQGNNSVSTTDAVKSTAKGVNNMTKGQNNAQEKTSSTKKDVLTLAKMKKLPDEKLVEMGNRMIEKKLSNNKKFMSEFNANFNGYYLEKELRDRGYRKDTHWVSCSQQDSGGTEVITLLKPDTKAKRQSLSIPDDGTYEKYKTFYRSFPYPSMVTKLALDRLMDDFNTGKIEFRFTAEYKGDEDNSGNETSHDD